MTSQRIDAHHHLWRYTPAEFDWIDSSMRPLQRDFLPSELAPLLLASGVTGTVAVQARQTLDETRWLLSEADRHPWIRGVVGWLPLADPDLPSHLDALSTHPRLKGLRHVVQSEPPGFLDGDRFNQGIRQLAPRGLTYDLLVTASQLEETLRFVHRHPQQSFIIDHIAKPAIATGGLAPWATQLRRFAPLPNVTCKLSGMVTEAGPASWSTHQLQPYFDVALETFGPHRLMVGTDWPVLTLECGYADWWHTVEAWIAPLSVSEQSSILAGTAIRTYNLVP